MSDDELRERLLGQDPPAPQSRGAYAAKLRDVAAVARARTDRTRRVMIGAWATFLALRAAGIVLLYFGGAGPAGAAPPSLMTPIGMVGRLALIVAVACTVSYLVRSRGASMAEMNHRLARLEELVESMVRARDTKG